MEIAYRATDSARAVIDAMAKISMDRQYFRQKQEREESILLPFGRVKWRPRKPLVKSSTYDTPS